jgi:autotransporter translocation and assembly factor TamB
MTGLKGPWQIDGRLSLSDADLHYDPYNLTVKNTNANVAINGSTQSPDIVFNMTTGSADADKELISGSQINGKIRGSIVKIDSCAIFIQSRKALSVKGSVPIAAVQKLNIDTNAFIDYRISSFPLKILEIFLPGIYIKDGEVNGKGGLSVRNGRLQSNGDLTLRNCIFETEVIDQKIGPVNGDILLSGDSISLVNWVGRINKGKFTINGLGKILQNGKVEVSAGLKGKDITVDMPDLVNIQVQSADMQIDNKNQKNQFVLKGTVDFGPTRFIRNINPGDIVSSSKLSKSKYQKKSIIDSILLQLNLQFQDNLYVDMNLGNMQLSGALAVSGTIGSPSLVGSIDAVTGEIFYLDRKFEIQKGNVNFENPIELNPSIYLEAKTDVTTFSRGATQSIVYNINLVITGNMEHPVVTFTSSPPLNEPNILSVLTLGTTIGSVGSDIASRIGSLAGNEILGFGTRRLERLLNLESLTVSGNIFNSQDKNNEPQLTVTKRLSDRLTLSYETVLGNLNEQTISILYRLFPFLFLAGQTDNSGNSNINLKFRIYR